MFLAAFSVNAQSSRIEADNQVNKNSVTSLSITATDDFIDNLSVYPNPVADFLKISFKSGKKSRAMLSLFNNIGKQVYVQESEVVTGNNLFSIDLRSKSIESGIYFIQIVVENEVITRKVIVK